MKPEMLARLAECERKVAALEDAVAELVRHYLAGLAEVRKQRREMGLPV